MRLIFQISVLLPDTIFQVIFLMFSFIMQILGCHVLLNFLGDKCWILTYKCKCRLQKIQIIVSLLPEAICQLIISKVWFIAEVMGRHIQFKFLWVKRWIMTLIDAKKFKLLSPCCLRLLRKKSFPIFRIIKKVMVHLLQEKIPWDLCLIIRYQFWSRS